MSGGEVDTAGERLGFLYIGLAVLTFSTSAIFVRWAAPLSALTMTSARLLLGAVTVVALGLISERTWRPPPRQEWPRYLLFGLIAAAHFFFYIAAVEMTTIAHALSITYTAPIWVTLFAGLFLKERLPRRKWIGVGVAVAGIAVLAGFEPKMNGRMILGDLMALGAAVCYGLYSVVGRSQRASVPLFTYAATVYALAGLWIAAPAVIAFQPEALSWGVVAAVVGAAVFPLAIGHTLYNAALRRLHPTLVSVVATQEVTGGVLLGIFLLGEVPSLPSVVGALVALVGVIWTLA